MESLISNVLILVTVIGILAIAISVITQVTKTWGFLDKIPTAIQVYVISLLLTVLVLVIYLQVQNLTFVWYYIVGAILLSFFVSFVTTNGWDQLIVLCKRFYKTPNDMTAAMKTDKTNAAITAEPTTETEVK